MTQEEPVDTSGIQGPIRVIQRRPTPWYLWLVIGGVAVIALGALAIVAFNGSGDKPAAAAQPTATPTLTPTPTPTHLDEAAACALLIPAAKNGGVIIDDFNAHTDGSTVDQPTLDETVTDLNQVKAYGPPDLQASVQNMLTPLAALQASFADHESRQIDVLAGELSAQDLLTKCAPYGS